MTQQDPSQGPEPDDDDDEDERQYQTAHAAPAAAAPPPHCPPGGVNTPPPTDPSTVGLGACEVGPWSQPQRATEVHRLRHEATHCLHQDPRCAAGGGYPSCAHPC